MESDESRSEMMEDSNRSKPKWGLEFPVINAVRDH